MPNIWYISRSTLATSKGSCKMHQIFFCSIFTNSPFPKIFKVWRNYTLIYSDVCLQALNKTFPTCFHTYFNLNSSVYRFGTRQVTRGDLFKSFKNTNLYGLKSIKYFDSKLWNTLPLFIRVSGSTYKYFDPVPRPSL